MQERLIEMSSAEALYQIADELRGIACWGLRFAQNEYDKDRYERILAAGARIINVLEHRTDDTILEQFKDNLLHLTPLAGAEAVVVREGALLLIKRSDDGLWAVPGGSVEIGETLAGAAQRELWEETGLRGRAVRLLGIFDSRQWATRTKVHLNSAIFLCEADDDSPKPGSEATDVGFFREENLPPLSPGHHHRVPFLFKILRGEVPVPYFDMTPEHPA